MLKSYIREIGLCKMASWVSNGRGGFFPQMLLELSEYMGKQHYAQKEAYMPDR